MQLTNGEVEIATLDSVEDSVRIKGQRGRMTLTNLRVMWQCYKHYKRNISIGLDCISSVSIKKATSKTKGTTRALFLNVRYRNSTLRFILTSLVKSNPNIFSFVSKVRASYQTSGLFRDLKLRGAFVHDEELVRLPNEEVYSHITGVWSLANGKGSLGSLFVTNVRIVWYSSTTDHINASVPYLQISKIMLRDSERHGSIMVMVLKQRARGLTFGFKIDPVEKLPDLFSEITSMYKIIKKTPNFGVQYRMEDADDEDSDGEVDGPLNIPDDVEIVHDDDDVDPFALYCDDKNWSDSSKNRDPIFNTDLGLAVEPLPEGLTISKLWGVVSSSSKS